MSKHEARMTKRAPAVRHWGLVIRYSFGIGGSLVAHSSFPPIRRKLLTWFDKNRRDLPWRRDRDPYRIWVSEVMLQQTTVAAVIPYFERFLSAFPDLRSLAAAREEGVLKLW